MIPIGTFIALWAPHPTFGHLLPASGAKDFDRRSPSPREAGRGWREAPGEGRPNCSSFPFLHGGADRGRHIFRERDGGDSILPADQRALPFTHALQKRLELRAQRLFFLDSDRDRLDGSVSQSKSFHFLLFGVDGDVR